MSRLDLITALIVGVCLFALGFLVYKVVGLMNAKSNEPIEQVIEEPISEYPDSAADEDLDDEQVPGPDPIQADLENSGLSDYERDEMDETASAAETAPTRPATPRATTAPDNYDTGKATSAKGRYMVVAGTFGQKANAEARAEKIRGMGYANVEVSYFDRGKYAVVLVDRFDSLSEARTLEKELGDKGIEVLVKEQR